MEEIILREALASTDSMLQASIKLGITRYQLQKLTEPLGLWNPNIGGKCISKKKADGKGKIPLHEILQGLHPYYKRVHLKKRLLDEGIKKNECEDCGVNEWMNKPISCHLDHINGIPDDHRLLNLRMLCPNCHSQTETYSIKNRKDLKR